VRTANTTRNIETLEIVEYTSDSMDVGNETKLWTINGLLHPDTITWTPKKWRTTENSENRIT